MIAVRPTFCTTAYRMSVIFRSEGADARRTSPVVSATLSSNDIPNNPPIARPLSAAFLKKTRRVLFIISKFFLAHRQLARVMIQPIQKVLSYLLGPLAVDLTRQVFLFPQTLMTEFIP